MSNLTYHIAKVSLRDFFLNQKLELNFLILLILISIVINNSLLYPLQSFTISRKNFFTYFKPDKHKLLL